MGDGSPNLSVREAQALEDFLADYKDLIETRSGDRGRTETVYQRTVFSDYRPISQTPRGLTPAKQALVNDLDDMNYKGVFEESDSPWSSQVLLFRKKGGIPRFVLYYRRMNEFTMNNYFPSRGLKAPWIRWLEPIVSLHYT
jgi:hypothetical protein